VRPFEPRGGVPEVAASAPGSLASEGWQSPLGRGYSHGTCGELVQGVIAGREFMITHPVDLEVRAVAMFSHLPGITMWPPHKVKARQAGVRLLDILGYPADHSPGIRIDIASPIPEGRGFASSSADIVASCRAIADLLTIDLSGTDLGAIACAIEPTDAVMFDHPVAYDFFTGHVICDPSRQLALLAVCVDDGEPVETTAFRRLAYDDQERRMLSDAYDQAIRGLTAGDLSLVGAAATVSANVNQRRLPKPHLDELLAICLAHRGAGVCVAHSGTVTAMLFRADEGDRAVAAAMQATRAIPHASISILRSLSDRPAKPEIPAGGLHEGEAT
jgi:L-threonine kinase